MKFLCALLPLSLSLAVSASPLEHSKRDVDPTLIPQFGFQAGVNPTGTGDCDGAVKDASGNPVKIPCACPPDRNLFISDLNANVAAGHAVNNPSILVSFPTDDSTASQIARIQAALVTLQNLNGPGQGCPAASTTFVAQQQAIQAGKPAPAPAAAPAPAPAAPAAPAAVAVAASAGAASAAQISQLAPSLGAQAGLNPTGTGDCDGAVKDASGAPVKVPCACPPDQTTYINALTADVAAGHAVNNPSIAVSFPTDNSPQSQITRIQAALVALQNLNGPGKGCPAASTTLLAQQSALQSQL